MKGLLSSKLSRIWLTSAIVFSVFFMVISTTEAHAGDKVSYGMTKVEAFDAKGTPDKINRMADEPGKEMWVYKCMGDDGFNEDCLYLYFDGDKLIKIERP